MQQSMAGTGRDEEPESETEPSNITSVRPQVLANSHVRGSRKPLVCREAPLSYGIPTGQKLYWRQLVFCALAY